MGRISGALKLSANLAAKVAKAVSRLRGAPPSTVAKVAKRLGMTKPTSAEKLITLARNNKFATAAILYELYGAGHEIVTDLIAEDESVAQLIELFGFQPDSIEDTDSVADISKFAEEFAIIRDASAYVGGSFERLLAIRQALSLDIRIFELYAQMRQMRKVIG